MRQAGPHAGNSSSIHVGSWPEGAAYDPTNGYLYVANSGSNNVSVINGTKLIATVGAGSSPVSVTYDGTNGFVYVSNSGSPNVTVINGTKSVGSVAVGPNPTTTAYDARNGYVYVPVNGTNRVVFLNGTSIVGNVSVGNYPNAATFDPKNGFVYVENWFSNTLSFLNGTSLIKTVYIPAGPAGSSPIASTYDPNNGWIYVVDQGGLNVTALNGTTIVGSVGVGWYPRSATFDAQNGFIYVPGNNNVSVINGTTLVKTFTGFVSPYASAYDAGNGWVYVADQSSTNVTILNGTTVEGTASVGLLPWAIVYDNFNGYLYVMNAESANVTALPTPPSAAYPLVFTQLGLPHGTPWNISVDGVTRSSTSSSIAFSLTNGAYFFSTGHVDGYTSAPSKGTAIIARAERDISITFSPVTYEVLVTETGLPTPTTWSVTLAGTSRSSMTSSLSFVEPNGTYAFVVGAVSGWRASPGSGEVIVNGLPTTITVAWSAVPVYDVSFVAAGLPDGTAWSVLLNQTLGTSSTSTVVFSVPSGSFSYTVAAVSGFSSPAGGTVTVNGAPVLVNVSFSPLLHLVPLTFRTSGLGTGSNWSVTLVGDTSGLTIELGDGLTRWSNGASTIQFQVSSGNYSYSTSLSGYRAASGAVSVAAPTPATVTIPFVPVSAGAHASVLGVSLATVLSVLGLTSLLLGASFGAVGVLSRRRRVERGRRLVAKISATEWDASEEVEPSEETTL
ncbi:MAG: YncE family protein [Thermoplasmata archaeon]|nr:YncE family protein [Thermoplasmata archaeon]